MINKLNGKKVLVTGGTGMIGRYLVDKLLAKDCTVTIASLDEPDGLPAIKLEPLLSLRYKDNLSDDEMVNFQKRQLLDVKSPNPSVETFSHH